MSGLFDIADRAVKRFRARYRGPTWDWPTGTITRLSYDLRDCSLNGIPLGAPLDRLKPLGPAAWHVGSHYRQFYYYRLGLIVSIWDDEIGSFEVVVDPTSCPSHSWHPFAEGRLALLSPAEKWVDLTKATTDADVFALLGRPSESEPVGDQPMHTFKVSGHIIDTTHDANTGRLVSIEINAADDTEATD